MISPNLTVTPEKTTTYIVKALKIAGAEPCRDTVQKIDSIRITVRQPPKVELGSTRYLCLGDSITIGANASDGTPPYRYQWNPHPLISSRNQLLQTVKVDRSTLFILTVTDREGCIARDTLNVVMLSPPTMNAGADTTICRGASVLLGGVLEQGVPPITYRWTPSLGLSDTAARTPLATPDSTTSYIVAVTSSNGCIWRDTVTLTVAPQPSIDAGPSRSICADSSVVLSPTIAGRTPAAIQWTPSSSLSCADCQNPTARPTATTTYRVTITDSSGCTAVDSVEVRVLRPQLSTAGVIDFGTLDGCTSTRDTAITLTNSGDAPIEITEARIAGTSFSVAGLPVVLAPGESRTLTVRFSPQSSGSIAEEVELVGDQCGATARITLRGEKQQSLVNISHGAMEFGLAASCQATPRDTVVVIRNNGTAPATISPGVVSAPFSVASPNLPATIVAGDSLQLTVRYAPVAAGVFSDDLRLGYASGSCRDTLRLRLSGRVITPELAPIGVIDFGTLTGCATSRDTTIMLRNRSEIELRVTRLYSSSGEYLVTPSSAVIPPGDSLAVTVSYRPSSSGSHAGTIEAEYEPCGGSLGAQLLGQKQGVSVEIPDTVSFGRVVMCGDTTVSQRLPIRFSGSDGVIVSANVGGPFGVGNVAGQSLPEGVEQGVSVSFAPPAEGSFVEALELSFSPCGITKRVVVVGQRVTPKLQAIDLDFGAQQVGQPASGRVGFVNVGGVAVRVEGIAGVGSPFQVSSTEPGLPAEIAPGDTVWGTISYAPEAGEQSTTAMARTSLPCEVTAIANVRGKGEQSGRLTLKLPSLEASAGERVKVGVWAEVGDGGFAGAGGLSFSGVLRFNSSLLYPVGSTPMGSVVDGERLIGVSGQLPAGFSSGEVGSYEFVATLGNGETTALKLTDVSLSSGSSEVEVEPGEFRLNGICRFGTMRLIEAEGKLILKPNRPNPVTWETEIEYELIEGGQTKLSVVSTLGQEVLRLVDGVSRRGRYVVRFNAGVLPSGTYLYILETPTQRLTRMMNVAK